MSDNLIKIMIALSYFKLRGLELNITNLALYTGLTRPTVYKYLDKLEDFFLIENSNRLKLTKGGKKV